MLWNIGLTLALGAVVGGAVFLLDKPITIHPKVGRIVGASMIVGGMLLVVVSVDGPWWQELLGIGLAVVGGSSVGTARRVRRNA